MQGCPRGRAVRWLVAVLLLVAVPVVGAVPATAEAKTCRKGKRVVRCPKAPKSAKRPKRSINEQGPQSLTPPDVENGGGIGGGPDVNAGAAVAWATSQLKQNRWAWRCERFVEEAYGTRYLYDTAKAAADALKPSKTGTAPAGSIVYFGADSSNHGWGHVGIALGGGRMISALGTVRTTNYAKSAYWKSIYRGWVQAPGTWPGRIPPPPGPSITLPESTIRLTAPAFASTVSGRITLNAVATGVAGVAFDGYFATDVADPRTIGWHPLGTATPTAVGYSLEWDTHSIPNQGDPDYGTINIAAIALDRTGQRTGTRDYRRINVDNSTGPGQPPPPQTRAETAGGPTNTWTNPSNAGGQAGQQIARGQTVQISCRLTGFKVANGNTWWYRISDPPWSNTFYASADAFYNNGATTGPLSGTPWVDEAVPLCP